ncbi:hypothetical protein Afil01_42270 [Actinorhabdospora filicis]|uniref:Uncharacterized protein n=1 Tax=Actinorhabdospora filicis TaxID=1785913 RepID=A0A9W6SM19_9ACTN|nr:hypothetical protein [Actinorhabdospora filicis]GLZ79420.1 hypothetical protein Afil01_42270 [Actinorhabdospora filicis]
MTPANGPMSWLGFLSPEDPVRHLGPAELEAALLEGLGSADDEAAFAAANRLALEAFRAGSQATTTGICERQIAYAMAVFQRHGDARIMAFGLQPAINLLRMHGYAGDLAASMDALRALETIADGAPARVFGLDVPPELAASRGKWAVVMRKLARSTCLVESAKIRWRRGRIAEMIEESRRMLAKWPYVTSTGPFHASEAALLAGVGDHGDHVGKPGVAPMLRRIGDIHRLAHSVSAVSETAFDLAVRLHETRHIGRQATPSSATARQLASIGDSFFRLGNHPHGTTCFGEAHDLAVEFDPRLAGLIRDRWSAHAGLSAVPPRRETASLDAARLTRLAAIAAGRLDPGGSRPGG